MTAFITPLPLKLSSPSASTTTTTTTALPRLPARTPCPRHRSLLPKMSGGGPNRTTECDTPVKKFVDRLKGLGQTRIVVTSSAGVLETLTSWDGLFFATIPKGEYANLIKPAENLDMHLRLGGVSGARFENGVSRSASKAPTYIIRMLGEDKEEVVMTIFMQWDKIPEDIEESRIECWKSLKAEYATNGEHAWF